MYSSLISTQHSTKTTSALDQRCISAGSVLGQRCITRTATPRRGTHHCCGCAMVATRSQEGRGSSLGNHSGRPARNGRAQSQCHIGSAPTTRANRQLSAGHTPWKTSADQRHQAGGGANRAALAGPGGIEATAYARPALAPTRTGWPPGGTPSAASIRKLVGDQPDQRRTADHPLISYTEAVSS